MIIVGASGHALEVLDVLLYNSFSGKILFFDNISKNSNKLFVGKFPIIDQEGSLKEIFTEEKNFILGVGNPLVRLKMAQLLVNLGGELTSIISGSSIIGNYNIKLGKGLNIMHRVFISSEVELGKGVLLNNDANVHHNVKIGMFSEIGPRATLLGNVIVGDYCFIGSGSTILPKVKIGNNVIVGAGSTITKDIPDNVMVVGVPGRIIKELNKFGSNMPE